VRQSRGLLLRYLKPTSETGLLIAVTAPRNFENRYSLTWSGNSPLVAELILDDLEKYLVEGKGG
jgi:hypothetical protein